MCLRRLAFSRAQGRWSTCHHFTQEGHEMMEVLLQRVCQPDVLHPFFPFLG